MTAFNRLLRGNQNTILAAIRGNVVVEAGDFMVHNNTAGMISAGGTAADGLAADAYVYPFNMVENGSSSHTTIMNLVYTNFLGVALESSPSGVTEQITVAVDGVVQYPMVAGIGGVTVGALVSATSSATGTPPSAQLVSRVNDATYLGSTAYLGRIVKTESGASFVQFEIGTIYSGLMS